jgi:hypothetical protein
MRRTRSGRSRAIRRKTRSFGPEPGRSLRKLVPAQRLLVEAEDDLGIELQVLRILVVIIVDRQQVPDDVEPREPEG